MTRRDSQTGQSFYTIQDFQRDFPTDEACLDWLRDFLYPDGIYCKLCQQMTKHHRVKSRMSYSCDRCGHHEHPMANTIFQDSRTPLRSWFHAVFLMASTRCGISAKQLQREIGVTYKTAWRMFRQIRTLLNEPPSQLSGEVEIDETYIGGRYRGTGTKREVAQARLRNKAAVAGQVQRGGRLHAFHLPDGTAGALVPLAKQYIMPGAVVYSDELPAYKVLGRQGYQHRRVHHAAKVWVSGRAHVNTLESFWGLLKRGISGVYHSVGASHLQSYVNEYVFRYNHRSDEVPMFQTMMSRVEKA